MQYNDNATIQMSQKIILWLCSFPHWNSLKFYLFWLWSSAVEWLVGKTVGSETTVINDDTDW